MQMNVDVEAQTVDPLIFYLTGKQPAQAKDALAGKRPALLAGYGDLTRLRYDFPLVLIEGKTVGAPVRSLSAVIDDLLQKVAPPGMESEQLRKMILRIEREIRTLSAAGETGLLSELWDKVATRLEKADQSFGKQVRIARAALEVDGQVLDCQADMADALIGHLWSAVQEEKAKAFRATTSRLAIKLADILRADYLRSPAGRSADALRAGVGTTHQALIDFSALSTLLPKASTREALSPARRQRVEQALAVIKGQRFFAAAAGQARPDEAVEPYSFRFGNCADALAAYQARLPELTALVKAMAIAELEVDGAYVEAKHEVIFAGFDADSLSPQDTALFPDYLVSVGDGSSARDNAAVMSALSSGVSLKILANIDNIIEEAPGGSGYFASGLRNVQLASVATGLGEVFVLQSAGSNLYQLRERILRGLAFSGPALFSVFAGTPSPALPLYLSAAAAMQSRAFPAFSYDPSAGSDMASRFSLENNPQAEADWTGESFDYADANLQRIKQDVAFTLVDFLACDPRYHHHFAAVPRSLERDRMVPVAQWLTKAPAESTDSVPYVLVADGDNRLSRAVVDERAISAARRCRDNWHRLQELGGVHSSIAERLLAREKQAWEEQKRQEIENLKPAAAPAAPVAAPAAAPAVVPATAAPAAAEPAAPERSPDEAYIETERCSTCNECTTINDRMFMYNANKQAYIADIKAGTFAQMVEAAENCQLGIIHPGKPINPNEPGLEELIGRAEPFQ